MALRLPDPRAALVIVGGTAIFLAIPAWAWGSWSEFVDHPARLGACLLAVMAGVAALFSGANLGGLVKKDARTPLVIAMVMSVGLVQAWLPAYADRHDLATLDGDTTRYAGLALLLAGLVLRVGPMFALGSRFKPPWMVQDEHRLVTTGFYSFIRHPSYLGVFLGMAGWFLVFRCGAGFFLALLLVPASIPSIRKEESMLLAEFGEEYAAYKKRTWRLLPFIC
ncbi:MAG: methyltransferase family protein [Isosphaerales bacterium]